MSMVVLLASLVVDAAGSVANHPEIVHGNQGKVTHPVSRHSPVVWDSGTYPAQVPTRGVPDGPLAANGDLGLTVGGVCEAGTAIGRPSAVKPGPNASLVGALGLYLGKNDFWGWPEAVTYHASFQHFSVGYLLLGLRGHTGASGAPLALPYFHGSMSLEDGRLTARASSANSSTGGGFALDLDAFVLSERNTILANVSASCPAGVVKVELTLELSSDTIFDMPLNVSAGKLGVLKLSKDNVGGDGLSAPVLVPCQKNQVIFNSLRQWKTKPGAGLVAHNASGGADMCLELGAINAGATESRGVLTVPCAGGGDIPPPPPWQLTPLAGTPHQQLHTADASGDRWCLSVSHVPGNTTMCPGGPKQSYYTDPTPGGACQSMDYVVKAARCHKGGGGGGNEQLFGLGAASGFLSALGSGPANKCLSAVPPRILNSVAAMVKLTDPGGRALPELPPSEASSPSVARRRLILPCGMITQLTIGVATQRDTSAIPHYSPAGRHATATLAATLATIEAHATAGLLDAQREWWQAWCALPAAEF
jgi:hypothetical protein